MNHGHDGSGAGISEHGRLYGRLLVMALLFSGCIPSPTEKDLDEYFSSSLPSAAGAWTGQSSETSPAFTLAFTVAQASNGALTGTGTMREGTLSPVSITVSGNYQRPALTLTFGGMVYEGTAVQGAFQTPATTFIGASGQLRLTGNGYDKTVNLSLLKQ